VYALREPRKYQTCDVWKWVEGHAAPFTKPAPDKSAFGRVARHRQALFKACIEDLDSEDLLEDERAFLNDLFEAWRALEERDPKEVAALVARAGLPPHNLRETLNLKIVKS
jgi:hypothetical protein